MIDLIILVPVYNDWECLNIFCNHPVFKKLAPGSFELLIIDDGSFNSLFDRHAYPFTIDMITLRTNLGHQKALAIGLSYIHEYKKANKIIIMDADGEDNPEHILTLMEAAKAQNIIVSAKRVRRKEPITFRIGYRIYKILFRVLTGKPINSGNFMLVPSPHLERLIYKNHIWNHLAAGIIKTSLPIASIPIERSCRYAGRSTMNYNKLLLHGLGAIVVFIEDVTTRLLIFSLLILLCTSVITASIIGIKVFTDLAIPGWTSMLTSVMALIFLQSFLLTLFTLFLYLASQSQRQLIPAIHYKEYISTISDQ